jgi:DNA invertase Pin-like site-specific DNA recombinase
VTVDKPNPEQRAVLYLRVASADPRDQQAVAHQRQGCLRIAAKHGLTVVREYVDLGRPARPAKQAALQQLFTDLAEYSDTAYVIVWNYARLAHDMDYLNAVISELRARGAEVLTMTGVEVAERFMQRYATDTALASGERDGR